MEQHLSFVIRGDIFVSLQRNICCALISSVQANIHSIQLHKISELDGTVQSDMKAGWQADRNRFYYLPFTYLLMWNISENPYINRSFLCVVFLSWQAIDVQMRNLRYIFNMDIWMIIKSIEAKPAQSPLNNGWEVDVTQFVQYKNPDDPGLPFHHYSAVIICFYSSLLASLNKISAW